MDQKSKWRLHLRHSALVVAVFSVIVLICAAIWFGTHKMPTTLAYLTPSKAPHTISAVSSQNIPATSSQSVSAVTSQISSEMPQNSSMPSVSGSAAYQQSYPNLYVPSVEKPPPKRW